MRLSPALVVALLGTALVAAPAQAPQTTLVASTAAGPSASAAAEGHDATAAAEGRDAARSAGAPLQGATIVIDPGHQLGNARFPRKINRPVSAGGLRKACNTTGTATAAGYPEATFAWRVAVRLRTRLEALGATVVMTRDRNSRRLWGPCVDVRGKLGNAGYRGRERAADLKISIHGDGAAASGHGFHVITTKRRGAVKRSARFGREVRAALESRKFRRSTYTAGGRGLVRRGDLGTLNLSRVPTAMVELGNMRNRRDARTMRSAAGQRRYAKALANSVVAYLGRY
ncbi:N-acetylmuramoyl-L-alanine amidase family protein [Mumia zhuanghuii]|uniref:N-acetylmuramoyl-L-alanine amidase n=1 Tax=Mumia zhuanghuii TaxID=2585211 RepID=A0A5C4MPA3_9ACTN|nr:N-acetylmuramoyl-L-alanine amidase [Mumia zhuanghuii]TNC46195.1 N-acetylmuramoyl-L-alanine amidase [Mumia zhuanghuii]TNC46388.1 N-acetylmuramoyl-L-alanine amidase [Mumia zhuanghuii]